MKIIFKYYELVEILEGHISQKYPELSSNIEDLSVLYLNDDDGNRHPSVMEDSTFEIIVDLSYDED